MRFCASARYSLVSNSFDQLLVQGSASAGRSTLHERLGEVEVDRVAVVNSRIVLEHAVKRSIAPGYHFVRK